MDDQNENYLKIVGQFMMEVQKQLETPLRYAATMSSFFEAVQKLTIQPLQTQDYMIAIQKNLFHLDPKLMKAIQKIKSDYCTLNSGFVRFFEEIQKTRTALQQASVRFTASQQKFATFADNMIEVQKRLDPVLEPLRAYSQKNNEIVPQDVMGGWNFEEVFKAPLPDEMQPICHQIIEAADFAGEKITGMDLQEDDIPDEKTLQQMILVVFTLLFFLPTDHDIRTIYEFLKLMAETFLILLREFGSNPSISALVHLIAIFEFFKKFIV